MERFTESGVVDSSFGHGSGRVWLTNPCLSSPVVAAQPGGAAVVAFASGDKTIVERIGDGGAIDRCALSASAPAQFGS